MNNRNIPSNDIKQHIIAKIIFIFIVGISIAIIEFYLFKFSLKSYNNLIKITLNFVQCWMIILFGFTLFQTFKKLRLPKKYYQIRKFENINIYNFLQVPAFQFVLVNSFFRYLNPRVYLKGRKKEYIKTYYNETKRSETAHILTMALTLFIQCLYLYIGEIQQFIYLSIFTIIFNVYPILLQRKNRMLLKLKVPTLISSQKQSSL